MQSSISSAATRTVLTYEGVEHAFAPSLRRRGLGEVNPKSVSSCKFGSGSEVVGVEGLEFRENEQAVFADQDVVENADLGGSEPRSGAKKKLGDAPQDAHAPFRRAAGRSRFELENQVG